MEECKTSNNFMQDIEYLKKFSHQMRLRILELTYGVGKSGAHVGGGLSAVEIMSTLYGAVLTYDIRKPDSKNKGPFYALRARVILP